MYSIKRFNTIAPVILANVITLVVTLIYNWSLLEVAIVYWWEFLVIVIFTMVKVLRAKTIRKSILGNIKITPFQVLSRKLVTLFIIILMYGMFLSGFYLALIYLFNANELGHESLLAIYLCVLFFFINQFISYYHEQKAMIYNELLSDNEIMIPMWRILPLFILFSLLAIKYNEHINYSIEQFVFVIAVIASINIALHIIHIDQCDKKIKLVKSKR